MEIESNDVDAMLAWLLVDSLSLEQAVSLAVGRVPIFGRPRPPAFAPLLRAAELAVENGQLAPSNDWKSLSSCRHYGNNYVEPEVTKASFREWLEKALSEKLKNGAFFYFQDAESWPTRRDEKTQTANIVERLLPPRAESTYLNIIGGLLTLMLGETLSGKPQSVYKDQEAIIAALLAHHAGKPGIAKRTLQKKLAAAKRSLTAA